MKHDTDLSSLVSDSISRLSLEPLQPKQRLSLTLLVSGFVFAIVLVVVLFTGAILYALIRTGALAVTSLNEDDIFSILRMMVLISLVLGAVAAFFLVRFILSPVNTIINAMNALAAGDFSTRISFSPLLAKHPAIQELTRSFNTMARELEGTEMLRADFVDNFSHEFKTPIVSIAGFAKVLKNVKLSQEERNEYLDIMEQESLRLANMATNVLTLTKLENQTILTDVHTFNLSEQLRNCTLMLENKWEDKHLDISIDLEEYQVSGNEDQLRQVWINLLDNAIKFSPRYGTIVVEIHRSGSAVCVSIANEGEIPPDRLPRIFKKFYQAEESHASEGNGIGLSIVQKIVALHGGAVNVKSENNITTFTVVLPCP